MRSAKKERDMNRKYHKNKVRRVGLTYVPLDLGYNLAF